MSEHLPASRLPASRQRLLLRGLGVLVVLFGYQTLARLTGGLDWPVPLNTSAPGAVAAGVWLLLLLARRSRPGAWCAGGLTAAGLALLPVTTGAGEAASVVLLTAAGTWLCCEVARGSRVPLWSRALPGTRPWWDGQAVACCLVAAGGHVATGVLAGALTRLTGTPVSDQADAMRITSDLQFAVTGLVAGAREEVPLLALVVALMAAARCPAWQVMAAVCLARVLPHAYLGLAAAAFVATAAVSLWVYRTSGLRIGPIIAGHTLYNALVLTGGDAAEMALLGITLVAIVITGTAPGLLRPATGRALQVGGGGA